MLTFYKRRSPKKPNILTKEEKEAAEEENSLTEAKVLEYTVPDYEEGKASGKGTVFSIRDEVIGSNIILIWLTCYFNVGAFRYFVC